MSEEIEKCLQSFGIDIGSLIVQPKDWENILRKEEKFLLECILKLPNNNDKYLMVMTIYRDVIRHRK